MKSHVTRPVHWETRASWGRREELPPRCPRISTRCRRKAGGMRPLGGYLLCRPVYTAWRARWCMFDFNLQDLVAPPPWGGYLAPSGDISGCHNLGGKKVLLASRSGGQDPERHPACPGQARKRVTAQPRVLAVPRLRNVPVDVYFCVSQVTWPWTRCAVRGLLFHISSALVNSSRTETASWRLCTEHDPLDGDAPGRRLQ